jgi:DMSO/TMAO reductase YedYZ molybdopterin-dependent catalytic subunit
VSAFPVRTAEDDQPDVPLSRWTLRVDDLVARPLMVDAAAWARLPRSAETRDFHCVDGWSVDKVRWAGVRLADVLREAGTPAPTLDGGGRPSGLMRDDSRRSRLSAVATVA